VNADAPSKHRVLVVDDSRLMQKAALKMLGGEFDVITADDGIDGWEKLQADASIQVVFTDLTMPRADGYELLALIRSAADPGLQGLPVIVVTGAENDESARMKALELGATDFITKPFTTIDLLARARAHANHQRLTRQLQAQATIDAVTGMANKAGFLDRLQQDIAYARRHQQELALVRIEIDDFRSVFLNHGKEVAEAQLLGVAQLIRARIRREDTAARIGLGGFALSMPAGKADGIAGMVERLRADVAALPPPAAAPGLQIALTCAVTNPQVQDGQSAQEALDACQARLGAPVAPVPAPPPAPVVPEPAPPPTTPPLSIPIDPILDEIRQGQTRSAIEKMPLLLNRLLPLLRLLTPNQREHLIRFLQQLNTPKQ